MPITVGCDPEFLAVDINTGRTTSFQGNHSDEHGNIGSDHGGRVGELRPKFGSPKEVVENIRAQMAWIKERYPNIRVVAGGGQGYGESIGGHIHIGGIRLTNHYSSFTRMRNRHMRALQIDSINPEHKLIYALDFFIGRRMKKVQGGRRGGGGSYGAPSDIETKTHGFEYRTPPSWLTDPVLAESVLVVAQKIAEVWQTKPNAFDVFISANKLTARRRDYNVLIPSSGPDARYVREQVEAFRTVLFSKTYRMDNNETINLWLKPKAAEVQTITAAARTSQRIQLQVCQLKLVEQSQEFSNETFLKVCRFALPEVKIHPLGDYAPWQFQLTKDLRLRPDTAYFSKELRPFLKVKRGKDIRVRFVELQHRVVDEHGRTQITPLQNVVFFNASRSTKDVLQHVVSVFETGARTKLRAANEADDGDDE